MARTASRRIATVATTGSRAAAHSPHADGVVTGGAASGPFPMVVKRAMAMARVATHVRRGISRRNVPTRVLLLASDAASGV